MVQRPEDKLNNKVDPADAAEAKAKKKLNVPKGAKVPQDHQSPKADVVDTGDYVTVEFEGQEYKAVLTAEEVGRNLDLMELLSEGNIIPAMKQILGPGQWIRFKNDFRDPETKVTDALKAQELFEATMEAMRLKNS